MKILITGGAGYIGSHLVVRLHGLGHEITYVDTLENSSEEVVDNIKQLTNDNVSFFEMDIKTPWFTNIMQQTNPDCVIHLAGLKSIEEGDQNPSKYLETNVEGTLNVLQAMKLSGCGKIIFSSSASIYEESGSIPFYENCRKNPKSFYGATKLMAENLISSWASQNDLKVFILRYFNPIGSHKSGLLGDSFAEKSYNLVPRIKEVLDGTRNQLEIYGNDWDTEDGYAVRDYIHIEDLVRAHVEAVISMRKGTNIYNVGSGRGYSVREIIDTVELLTGTNIPTIIKEKRQGDIPCLIASIEKIGRELKWKPREELSDMLSSALKNPA